MVTSQTKEARKRRQYLRGHAKRMRHEPTAAEIRFWYQVRDRRLEGWKFRDVNVPVSAAVEEGRRYNNEVCDRVVEGDGWKVKLKMAGKAKSRTEPRSQAQASRLNCMTELALYPAWCRAHMHSSG